ncbi:MAG: hypothetical protein RBT33_00860 [Candidatus Dojkabacteria bacterium]|jgi:hypothetical protein|nr:hypothetical protein [Candidatus Dojkabacteria bacterium]MDX9738903.1 hypothetical protein [Candidatus Dojkabacteria bacterium]
MAEYDSLPEGFVIQKTQNTQKTFNELPAGFEIEVAGPSRPSNHSLIQGPVKDPKLPPNSMSWKEVMTPEDIRLQNINRPNTPAKARDIVSTMEGIYETPSQSLDAIKGIWNPEARARATEKVSANRQRIVNELASQGFENPRYEYDSLYVDFNGESMEVDSSIMQILKDARTEIGASIALGLTGAKLGATAGAPLGPVGAGVGAFVGGGVFSAAGAAIGKKIDIEANELKLTEKVSDDLIKQQMKEAGVTDAIGSVIGPMVMKLPGKAISKIYNQVLAGNMEGAKRAALQHYGIDAEQATKITQSLEELIGPLAGTEAQKDLVSLSITQPGGEAVWSAASLFNPSSSADVANSVVKRAASLRQASSELANTGDETIYDVVTNELSSYTDEVGKFYESVKDASREFSQGYAFDYNKLGLQPIIERIGQRIEDPTVKQRYLNLLTKVEDAADGRTFSDLIDLRETVNDLMFASKSISFSDKGALLDVVKTIDNEIATQADIVIPEAALWKENWSKAKANYSEMKRLEKNVLAKVINRPGISPQTLIQNLSKYIAAGDDTFYEVMEKLSNKTKTKIEGSVINNIVDKFSVGEVGGHRAIAFGALSDELSKAKWHSPEAKQLVDTIHRMSNVFKNDVNLARVAGKITVPKFQSYLTTDPVVRLKYEVASSLFNYIRMLIPSEKADVLALARQTGDSVRVTKPTVYQRIKDLISGTERVYNNPLDASNIKALRKTLEADNRLEREALDFEASYNKLLNEYKRRQEVFGKFYSKEQLAKRPDIVWGPATMLNDPPIINDKGEIIGLDSSPAYGILSRTGKLDTVRSSNTPRTSMNPTQQRLLRGIYNSNSTIKQDVNLDKYIDIIDSDLKTRYRSIGNGLRLTGEETDVDLINNLVDTETTNLINKVKKDLNVELPLQDARSTVISKLHQLAVECGGKK